MRKLLAIACALALPAVFGACAVQPGTYNDLVQRNEQLDALNNRYKDELLARNKEIEDLAEANKRYQAALDEANKPRPVEVKVEQDVNIDSELAKLREMLEKELNQQPGFDGFNTIRTTNAVGVRLDDGKDVLFRPGGWDLTANAKSSLDSLAAIVVDTLKKHPEYVVRIDGHTDSDPIRNASKAGVEDNTHLGFLRANTVRKYLVEKGVDAQRISVLSAGEHIPVAGEKKLNRRVELWVSTPEGFSIGAGGKRATSSDSKAAAKSTPKSDTSKATTKKPEPVKAEPVAKAPAKADTPKKG